MVNYSGIKQDPFFKWVLLFIKKKKIWINKESIQKKTKSKNFKLGQKC